MNDKTVRHPLTTATSLDGATIVDRDGEDSGQLEEILILAKSGRVAYAVLSFGSLFDQGFRYVAVPWDAMTVDPRVRQLPPLCDPPEVLTRHLPSSSSWARS